MSSRPPAKKANHAAEGEFLWLISFSDLLILLFIFFVVMFSISYKKIRKSDFAAFVASLRNEQVAKGPLEEVTTRVEKLVRERKLEEVVTVTQVDDAVAITIRERVLFPSAEYRLNAAGVSLLQQILPILEQVPEPYRIGIEGHTDDVPVRTASIPDNWELAARRAHSVLQALQPSARLLRRIVLLSYGEMQPVVPNRSPSGVALESNRGKNRRVTLRIY